jgi:HlyD family secretion protein
VTQGVVNYPVLVSVSNPDASIMPGMTANLAITVAQDQNVLIVPLRAVRTQGTQKMVTVLYQGQEISVTVQVGLTNDTDAEITGGQLKAGDEVVVSGSSTTTQPRGGGPGGFFFGRGG